MKNIMTENHTLPDCPTIEFSLKSKISPDFKYNIFD